MLYDTDDLCISPVSVADIEWKKHSGRVRQRPYSALSFRLSGQGTLKTELQSVKVKEGDVLFLPQGMDYDAFYTDGEILVIHFELKNKSCDRMENYTLSDPKAVLPLFRRACHAWQNKRVGYKLEITALFYEILLALRRQSVGQVIESSAFERAIEMIKAEYKDPLLLISDVCQRAGISESYFRRLSKKILGTHPAGFLTELRLSNAEILLHQSSYSVERAAVESGFSDPKYFARVVKKLRGCSPSELRFN